jgi:dipeptidyl aminopeptidase/acylaminoacyl peptidase
LFSFGAVLYEMLSGQRAFRGRTTADTVSAILKDDAPNLSATGRDIPPQVERIVSHCLERDPEARLQSARDLAFDLESVSSISAATATAAVKPAKTGWMGPVAAVLIAATLGLLAGLLVGHRSTRPTGPPRYRQLTFAHGAVQSARFAPDQRTVLYESAGGGAPSELWAVTSESQAPLNLGLKNADLTAVSPTGEMLVLQQPRPIEDFATASVLARAPMTGGAPRPVLNDVQDADWGKDAQIAAAHFAGGRCRLEYPLGHVLYETDGYISDVRVSPKGDQIAFADHPVLGDNSGTVAVVDSSGHKRNLGRPQSAILGLAWAASGQEIWFSGAEAGSVAQLKSVDLLNHERMVADAPGSLVIQDVARNGAVLLRHDDWRAITVALGPGQNREQDLTITDFTLAAAISRDGRQVLLDEQGTGSHAGGDIYLRSTDGSPPVRIGEGSAEDFSPDMKWFLAKRGQLFLVPVGPGEPRQITNHFSEIADAHFLPGGQEIVFSGTEPGHKSRIYTQAIGSNSPRAISPEGVSNAVPTADGKFVFGSSDIVALYPVDGQGAPRAVQGIQPDDLVVGVSADGHSVLIQSDTSGVPFEVLRVSLDNGRREPFKKLGPADLAGRRGSAFAFFTPDGKYYTYTYDRILSELYAVDGLR